MVNRKLDNNSITQYKLEERSFMAKRMITSPRRATRLIKCMKNDTISFPNNVQLLKKHLIKYVGDVKFKECNNMGEILETILVVVKRNYQDVHTKQLAYFLGLIVSINTVEIINSPPQIVFTAGISLTTTKAIMIPKTG